MLNMIRMDLYRLFRTKSMYVIWLVLAAGVFFSTYMSTLDVESMKKQARQSEGEPYMAAEGEGAGNVNVGMTVSLPTLPGEKVTVADEVYANLQAKFVALFLVIFAVLFSSGDISSGYIKNVGGQVRDRGGLILSKSVALMVFTGVSMLLYLAIQAAACRVFFGDMPVGDGRGLFRYFAAQTLLHCGLMLICMAVSVIIKSGVLSMVAAICLTMNVMMIFYGWVDLILSKAGVKDFQVLSCTVTGRMAMMAMNPTDRECLLALASAAAFGAGAVVLSALVFRKRDI